MAPAGAGGSRRVCRRSHLMLSSEASVCDAIASPRCTCQHPGGRGDVAAGAGARERGRCTRGARGAGRAPRTAGASASGVPAAAAAAAHLGFGHLLLQRLRRSLEEPRGARAVRVAPEGGGAAKQVVHQRRQVRELLGRAVHGSPYRGHSKARRLQSSRGGGISSGLDTATHSAESASPCGCIYAQTCSARCAHHLYLLADWAVLRCFSA